MSVQMIVESRLILNDNLNYTAPRSQTPKLLTRHAEAGRGATNEEGAVAVRGGRRGRGRGRGGPPPVAGH